MSQGDSTQRYVLLQEQIPAAVGAGVTRGTAKPLLTEAFLELQHHSPPGQAAPSLSSHPAALESFAHFVPSADTPQFCGPIKLWGEITPNA